MSRLCHDTFTPSFTIYRLTTTLVTIFDTIISWLLHDHFMITLRLLYEKTHLLRCRNWVRPSCNMLIKSWTRCVTRLHAVGKMSSMWLWHCRHRNVRYIHALFTTFFHTYRETCTLYQRYIKGRSFIPRTSFTKIQHWKKEWEWRWEEATKLQFEKGDGEKEEK